MGITLPSFPCVEFFCRRILSFAARTSVYTISTSLERTCGRNWDSMPMSGWIGIDSLEILDPRCFCRQAICRAVLNFLLALEFHWIHGPGGAAELKFCRLDMPCFFHVRLQTIFEMKIEKKDDNSCWRIAVVFISCKTGIHLDNGKMRVGEIWDKRQIWMEWSLVSIQAGVYPSCNES